MDRGHRDLHFLSTSNSEGVWTLCISGGLVGVNFGYHDSSLPCSISLVLVRKLEIFD